MHPYIPSSSIHNHRDMEKTQCPLTDEWMQKMWYIYTMEYYSALKEKKPFAATWMELEIITLSEVKSGRELLLICGI